MTISRTVMSAAAALFVPICVMADEAQDSWREATVADALLAAPPAVTRDATVLGWTADGDLVVARYGDGPYTCIASGSFSTRLGKPALPYPDPMCLDQNAWSFLQAVWSGAEPDDLPTAPGLIWMLAGMSVSRDAVDVGASVVNVAHDTSAGGDFVRMTPHVMIMPLPFSESVAGLTTSYDLNAPLASWIMAAGQPHEHLMVHFSDKDVGAMMRSGQ